MWQVDQDRCRHAEIRATAPSATRSDALGDRPIIIDSHDLALSLNDRPQQNTTYAARWVVFCVPSHL